MSFNGTYRNLAPVKNPCGERGFYVGLVEHLEEVLRTSGAAGGNHRNGHGGLHRPNQFNVETGVGAVPVYTV